MGRVFIVDDNALTRVALSGIIRLDNQLAVVGQCSSGELALQAMGVLRPDVVCLDVIMPGMDGLTVLRRLRTDHPDVAVVMITAAATPQVIEEARREGANAFVVKPFNAHNVLRAVNGALRSRIQAAVAQG
jgi:two-component system, chemotaxis family, chemotaxis protein CheY